jgi:glutathione S-transferase
MKLFYSPGASSLAAHIALQHAGIPFTAERVDLVTKTTEKNVSFHTINPKGCVPALVLDDGEVLTEGVAIIQYITDRAPLGTYLTPPAGSVAHYRHTQWLCFIATELHKNFAPLFNPTTSAETKEAARRTLYERLYFPAQVLAKHDFLLGGVFSAADGYLFTVLNWANHVKMSLDDWPVFARFMQRVASRPPVQAALRAEGLLAKDPEVEPVS